jgi:glycine cleavage system H protein
VTAINDAVVETPDLVNTDPYGQGWLARVRLDDAGSASALLDVTAYRALLEDL